MGVMSKKRLNFDGQRGNRQGYVWEVFSEKVIFELSYNLAIQNVFLCITLSMSIFLNSFFSFIKNANCTYIFSSVFLHTFHMQIIEPRVKDCYIKKKYSPGIPQRIIVDLIYLIFLNKSPFCHHHVLIQGGTLSFASTFRYITLLIFTNSRAGHKEHHLTFKQ